MMVTQQKPDHDPWQIGCGHDMTATLAALLSQRLRRNVTSYTVERQLRLGYDISDFVPTPLCSAVKAWEQKNAPLYVILRQ